MSPDQINQVLHDHSLWLESDAGKKADLQGADLQGADLRDANLRCANLRYADLQDADLRYADLSGAYLYGADLRYADLQDADISGASLRDANLRCANLRYADLQDADLRYANLRYANLQGAEGFYLLPVQDARGYSFPHAVETPSGWRIRVGCRDFSINEAKEHWGSAYKGCREQGDMYLYAIEWLERKLEVSDE